VNGVSGKALSFDGVNDYVDIADSNELDPTEDFTLEFWIMPYHNIGRLTVMSKHATLVDNDYSWTIFIEADSKLLFENTYSGWINLRSDSIIENDKWTHIVITFNDLSNKMKIYVNGELDSQGVVNIDIRNNDQNFQIGTQPHHNPSHKSFFEGIMDEIQLYARELTIYEVQQHYEKYSVEDVEIQEDISPDDKPDFYLLSEDISFTDQNPSMGDIITIYTKIHNQGSLTGSALVKFYVGDPSSSQYQSVLIESKLIDISYGESKLISVDYTIEKEDSHEIYVVLSDVDSIEETLDNNIAYSTLYVGGEGEPILVVAIQ